MSGAYVPKQELGNEIKGIFLLFISLLSLSNLASESLAQFS
jgi:hypothetical protein